MAAPIPTPTTSVPATSQKNDFVLNPPLFDVSILSYSYLKASIGCNLAALTAG